jgi:tight adherence protein B
VTRIRKRLAALSDTPESRPSRFLGALVRSADLRVEPPAALRRAGWLLAGASAAGGVVLGLPGAALGPLCAAGGGYVWLRRRGSARLQRIAAAFPDAVRGMADAMRSGMNLPQAVALVAEDAAAPLDAELGRVVLDVRLGVPVARAVEAFAERCPVPGADLLALATGVASRSGADLAPICDGIVASARDRDRLHRELRAATAQGRLTATVVAALPVAFLAIMGGGARGEVHLLLREPAGWALLAVGGALDAAGFAWIRRMVSKS